MLGRTWRRGERDDPRSLELCIWVVHTGLADLQKLTGTIKDHDKYRGAKQTVLTRCKFDKFKIMTPDEAANAEVLA